jgi:2,4-dienoyl-CoA reductase-like NADH-dependent reductase (Old Yellow Enzyme family)
MIPKLPLPPTTLFETDLPNQFLESHSNQRTDEFGGSIEKRSKFVLEAVKGLIDVAGDSKKVGIKLTPSGGYNDMGEPEALAIELYTYLVIYSMVLIHLGSHMGSIYVDSNAAVLIIT